MRGVLARIPVYWSDETKDGHKLCILCCPFCMYTMQNNPAYLNHIVGAHYNVNFTCGACLSAVASTGQQMKRHINECTGLAPLLMTMPQESACGECHQRRVLLVPNMQEARRKPVTQRNRDQPFWHPRRILKLGIGV